MTTTEEIERSLAEEPLECTCDVTRLCPACTVRPAILTWAERKLDEAYADNDSLVRGQAAQLSVIDSLTRKLDEAKADSGLLAKVEAVLKECSDLTLFELQGDYFIDDPPTRITAPTLREALRKLVGEES